MTLKLLTVKQVYQKSALKQKAATYAGWPRRNTVNLS